MRNSNRRMHRPDAGGGNRASGPDSSEIGRLIPEWRSWIELQDRIEAAAKDPFWEKSTPELAAERPIEAPLLHGAALSLDPRPVRRWIRKLLKLAAVADADAAVTLTSLKARRLDAVELLRAAIAQDRDSIAAAAEGSQADPDALATVAQLAAIPLLRACGRRYAERVPANWARGYCPICGAWASLSELRGLDRARRLRCGRCGCDWRFSVLHCAFCDERDHKKLAALVPEGEADRRRTDTCNSCKGYMKTLSTLRALSPEEVLLEDLKSVELDVAAMERGYHRPDRPGFAVAVQVSQPHRGRFGFLSREPR